MSSNNILIKKWELLDEGFLLGCDAVSSTFGAEGKLCLLDNNQEAPLVSKDGYSVLQRIRHSNKTINFGILQALAGCARTMSVSGDSSTCTAIFMQGYLRKLDRSKFNKAVERGIGFGVEEVYKSLDKLAIKATKKDLKHIAKVSVNNDVKLAAKVIEAFDYVGKDGIVETIINKEKETTEVVNLEGLRLESHGYQSAFFSNVQSKKICYEAENVAVLCSATWEYSPHIISQIQLFYQGKERSTPLIVLLERPNGEMTEKLIGIKEVGYNICLVATNGYDEYESETLLKDVANFTGSVIYNPRNTDSKIIFGLADKVVSNFESTTFVVENVPQVFKDTLLNLQNADKRDERRIKRLTTKASMIEVGALTDSARGEIFHRVEDAIASVKTTMLEGYVPGGGCTFVYISGLMNKKFKSKEEQLGYDLVKEVLKEPILQLLKNANRKHSYKRSTWFSKLWDNEDVDYITPAINEFGVGYNASTDEISNLLSDGILDSKKSLKIALESATERAIQMFNIGVVVHYPSEKAYL